MKEIRELSKTYEPDKFEDRLYKTWKEGGHFIADANSDKPSYSIVMPPPNVTGNLHLGHAINNTLQDVLIRWKRMAGYEVLWVPGTDHASISTEARVVAKLESEGIKKEDLTREEFLKEAWDWTHKYGGNIKNQLERLGVSCDWTRDSFTLDEHLSKAVEEVFIRLYNKGFIYQGDRIVNWCPSCGTAISDIEVEHVDEDGKLYYINYPIIGEDASVMIATTRPETMLGDLAVAVNPNDERFVSIIGKKLNLPLVDREIPLIADEYVLSEFGTGAVKITPSHDPNDFAVGDRHNLGQCIVIENDATISDGYGDYSGKDRYVARKMIVEDLEKLGLLVKIEEHGHAVGHCERCSTVIEPLISKQWFVKMKELAKPAKEAYTNGELKLYPDRFGKVYTNWLDNIRDWCISRQLWWGHRLPVYYCTECNETIISREMPDVCPSCGSDKFIQDPDTLDTWFSSALWPFSTLGWPEDTQDLKKFFPTNVLVTGYDIIFFWVIRMVFSSIQQMGELPFKDVYFNGLVRDSLGRKMSKSLNNGIDPLEVIDQYGADALRFMLVTGNTPGNDMRFYIEKVEASRNFANKLWNASRFVLMHMDDDVSDDITKVKLETSDKWIITKLQNTIENVELNLGRYDLGIAAGNLHDFIWDMFCDWYIELVKNRLFSDDQESKESTKTTLLYVLKNILKLLHPFMPFITEEIYSYLPNVDSLLINAQWPAHDKNLLFEKDEFEIETMIEAIKSIRNIRSEMNIHPSKKSDLYIYTNERKYIDTFKGNDGMLHSLANILNSHLTDSEYAEDAISIIKSGYKLFIPLKGLIDYEKELERLNKERENIESEIKRASSKLNNESFVSKAPEKVVQAERDKLEKYESLLADINQSIKEVENKKNEL